MKTVKELKELYLHDSGNYLPKGGVLLESVGSEVTLLQYNKDGEGSQKSTITLHYMGDFDINTITYEIKYSQLYSNIIETARITPDGLQYAPKDEMSPENTVFRITPLSCLLGQVEKGIFADRLESIYENPHTLTEKMIMAFSKTSGDNKYLLEYCYNIVAILKFPDNTFGYFRVNSINLTTVSEDSSLITISDGSNNYHLPVNDTNSDLTYQTCDTEDSVVIRLFDLGNL